METTIKLHQDTKTMLDRFREYRNESYDEVIRKLLHVISICKKDPKLSAEAVDAIEKARERMRKGNYLTEDQAKKRLGL